MKNGDIALRFLDNYCTVTALLFQLVELFLNIICVVSYKFVFSLPLNGTAVLTFFEVECSIFGFIFVSSLHLMLTRTNIAV